MTNIANLFNFIESNRPEYRAPLIVKLIYDPESITEDDLTVGGDLDLEFAPITTLPDNLKVGNDLNLEFTPITTLPDNLKVVGNLYLSDTPLSKQYSKDEIRKMIEDKGGNVGGDIYI